MTLYCSYNAALQIMGTVQTLDTVTAVDQEKVLRNLRVVSARVDRTFQQRRPLFAPYIETRLFPLSGQRVNSYEGLFRLDGYLLELTSTSVMGSAVTNVEGYPNSSQPPFPFLRLTTCCQGWLDQCAECGVARQVSITGVWGLHNDYAHAWLAVDALQAAVTASITTLTVVDAEAYDLYEQPYRISPGHLLKVDDEYMEVISTSGDVVTVLRAVNGSTAAAHNDDSVVYRWEVMPEVQYAVARQSGLMYSRYGAYNTVDISPMGAEVRYPADWLHEVMGVLQGFVYGL